MFARDPNGLFGAAEPNGFEGVVDEVRLLNGEVPTARFCDCMPKGFGEPPAGAAIADAKGLLMPASLFVVLNPEKAPPVLDDVEPRAFKVAFLVKPKLGKA